MPLPRLIVLIPCLTIAISLILEIINAVLVGFFRQHARSMLNFFLGNLKENKKN